MRWLQIERLLYITKWTFECYQMFIFVGHELSYFDKQYQLVSVNASGMPFWRGCSKKFVIPVNNITIEGIARFSYELEMFSTLKSCRTNVGPMRYLK